jgi:hypothetical protein
VWGRKTCLLPLGFIAEERNTLHYSLTTVLAAHFV